MDYSSSISQSNFITGLGSFTFASTPAMVTDVQDWVTNPPSNSGWILICELEDLERSVRKFGSSERTTITNRPSLEVQFILPAPPLTLILLPLTNGQFQFEFNAESNYNYTVEYSGDVGTSNWMVLTNISPLSMPTNVVISEPSLGLARFYRVRRS